MFHMDTQVLHLTPISPVSFLLPPCVALLGYSHDNKSPLICILLYYTTNSSICRPTEETALQESWHDNWATLSTYFKYPEVVRRLIYTTNAIEGFNRQLRKVTKSKTLFPTDDSLLKMLYLAMMDITKKWTGHRQDWGQIHSQLEIYFEERLEGRNL